MIMSEELYRKYTESESKGIPVLLSTSEVAELTGIGKSTLNLWRSQGVGVPYVRLRGRVFYKFASVIQYMQEGEQGPLQEFPSVA